MNRLWEHVLLPLARASEARVLCEIGSQHGTLTQKLLAYCAGVGGRVHVIDPAPSYDVQDWERLHGDAFVFHRALSLNVLSRLEPLDMVLVDGDHNWYTVLHELRLIDKRARTLDSRRPVIALHDTGWPYGRRDLYYDPATVPDAFRQPHAMRGMHPDSPQLVEHGLNDHLANALYEHDVRNGVLTAVEDFLTESTGWTARDVPGLHGLTVLVPDERLATSESLRDAVGDLGSSGFLTRHLEVVERERILASIERAREGRERQAVQSRLSRLEDEHAALQAELAAMRAELERTENLRRAAAAETQAARRELNVATATSHERIEELTRQLEEARRRLAFEADEAAARARDLARKLSEQEEARQGAEADARASARQVEQLDAELGAMNRAVAEARRERDELTARIEALEKRLGAAEAGELAMRRAVLAADERLQVLREEEAERRRDAARRLAHAEADARRAEAAREDLERHLERLREEIQAASVARRRTPALTQPEPLPSEPAEQVVLPRPTVADPADGDAAVFRARYQRLLVSAGLGAHDDVALGLPLPVFSDRSGGTPAASVIVCVHNALEDVRRCLASVAAQMTVDAEIVIVNDGSDQPTSDFLRAVDARSNRTVLIENPTPPHGYTIAANLGMHAARGELIVLLNSDTIVTAGWLERLLACAGSDPRIGIVGPASNAASHQSVPRVREAGTWATNAPPAWATVEAIAAAVAALSPRERPRVPFLNGFCYAIRRELLERVGMFDEDRFASGYAEENDYSVRAQDAGYELAVVDDAYVFHAKSRSYTVEGRNERARRNYDTFRRKHGESRVDELVRRLESRPPLAVLGERLEAALSEPAALVRALQDRVGEEIRPAFVLPGLARAGSGGSHSIVQEAQGMRGLEVPAVVAVPSGALKRAAFIYPESADLFVGYSDADALADAVGGANVVVATHYSSVPAVNALAGRRPAVCPAYYIQDYEPFFGQPGSPAEAAAQATYSAEAANRLLFAKTHWLCTLVAALHGVRVHKVRPSLDRAIYHARGRRDPGQAVRVVAMVRPRTPRRQPQATIRVLARLLKAVGDIDVTTFGCGHDELERLTRDETILRGHRGLLSRFEVADLLRDSDVFLDLSSYQAFGRTALEAMACGCVPVVPSVGGAYEFARPGVNAVAVDTADEVETFRAVVELVREPERVDQLRREGLATADGYSIEAAAVSEIALFAHALVQRTAAEPSQDEVLLRGS